MTLSRKTISILCAAAVVSFLLSYVVLRATVYSTFVELENEQIASNLARVDAAIHDQLDGMQRLNREYSQWNETYEYLKERDESYVEEYLTAAQLASLDVDGISILDKLGNSVAGIGDSLANLNELRMNYPVSEIPSLQDKLNVSANGGSGTAAIIRTNVGALLVVSAPVLRSDASGPPVGSFVLSRYLSESRVQQLQAKLGVVFRLFAKDSEQIPAEFRDTLDSLDSTPVETRQRQHGRDIAVYRTLRDIDGEVAFVVEVITPRNISAAGAQALTAALGFLALTSLFYLAISALSLRKLIILPLSGLTLHIGKMRETGAMAGVEVSKRRDEIGILTRQFNALVKELENARTAMVKANDETAGARDAAIEASRAKSQFLANMSHEIRTPMNGVMGMTELLLSSGLDDLQREYAEMVSHSTQSLLAIINDILDLSKIEVGKFELDIARLDLRETVEESLKLLAHKAESKGLVLRSEIPVGLQTEVSGDANRLRQILINLVGNAVKFTESGEVIVRMTDVSAVDGAIIIRTEVEDTGVGIEAESQSKIFASFEQADGSTTRQYGGTGLGLSICEQLVALMGGEIGVNSTPGKGSIFWFTTRWAKCDTALPLRPSLPDTSVAIVPEETALPSEFNALVAEDNPVNQAVTKGMLAQLGGRATMADDGSKALELFRNSTFDVVLMDCQMPGMDGYEASRAIREWESEHQLSATPIIALTANALSTDRQRCMDAGMDDYMSKPFTLRQLNESLLASLRERGQRVTAGQGQAPAMDLIDTQLEEPEAIQTPVDWRMFEDTVQEWQEPGGPDQRDEFITLFLETSNKLERQMDDAFELADLKSVGMAAHSWKSSCTYVGATQLVEFCARLEQLCYAGDLETACLVANDVRHEYKRVTRALQIDQQDAVRKVQIS